MASVVLRSVGNVAGNMLLPGIGGAFFGAIGGGLGNIVDGQLGLGTQITGPQLQNLQVQDSRYGAGIPIVYGNARIAGNIIWSTDLIETQHNSSVGGKGGSTSGITETTYTYSVHCAAGICAGPIAGFNTIWADSNVIYQDGVWASGLFDGVTLYTGAAGQAPDPFMESILGTGSVPAYKNLAYIVFDNLQLSSFGNRLPNLTFEIAAGAVTSDPVWTGGVDAGLSQRLATVQNATMAPLVVQGSSTDAATVLIGGFTTSGSNICFAVSEYDVTGAAPVLLQTVTSSSFPAGTPADQAWAFSPDGRFIVCYIQTTANPSHYFVLYDSDAASFGPVYSVNLTISPYIKQPAWIDAQHFVIDDIVSSTRGLHSFARAGSAIIDLGFTSVWGNISTNAPFLGAQFTPYADGLIAYNWVTSIAYTLTLEARTIGWRDNQPALGPVYTVASGLALGTGSGGMACFLQTAAAEWTLFYGTVVDYRLLSFEPSATSATMTRPWQVVTLTTGTGTTNFPLFYGDRLLLAQRPASGSAYAISEVALQSASFALTVDSVLVTGVGAAASAFCALRLDSARLLLMGAGGFAYDIGQLGIIERNAEGSIAAILADILTRAGYAAGDYNVTALNDETIQGYVLQEPMSARNAIEPLQNYLVFDLIETSGQLVAVLRGGSAAATVPSGEWRAALEGKIQPPPLAITRAQEMDLPREVDVEVIDPSRNFEVNAQRARRIATSARTVQKISLPIVAAADLAKQIAEARLYTAWAERDLVKLAVSRSWLSLDPSDVIDLGNGSLLRVASVTQSGGLIQIEGFYSYAASLDSAAAADGGLVITPPSPAPVSSVLYLMDLPLLQSTDDQPGLYAAVTGLPGWKGATIMRSSDGANYSAIASSAIAAAAGIAAGVLPNASGFYMDNAGTVNVQLTQGELSSCDFIDLTNGANAALLGGEIIQFQTAVLVGPGLYTLSNLLRGRRGTENKTATHTLGENFVLLQPGAVDFIADILSDRNQSFDFRALSNGQSLSDAQDYTFTYGMQTICPFSPTTITGTRTNGTSGDLSLSWFRRARLNAEWVDYIDVPLDEPQELYEADIMNGASIMRAFTGLTSPAVIYTAAQQTADWGGGIPAHFTVQVMQISSRYGNGNTATAVI